MIQNVINITPLDLINKRVIEQENYDKLIAKTDNGWSECSDEIEWLAKLHYLRNGFLENKISETEFKKKEKKLIINWWNKGV